MRSKHVSPGWMPLRYSDQMISPELNCFCQTGPGENVYSFSREVAKICTITFTPQETRFFGLPNTHLCVSNHGKAQSILAYICQCLYLLGFFVFYIEHMCGVVVKVQ